MRLDRNRGPSTARNAGIAAATGDVIAFLDADDIWLPRHCEVVSGLLERFPEAGVAASAARLVGTRRGTFTPHFAPERPAYVFWRALRYCPVPPMAAMVRRPLLLAINGYDERHRFAQDFDLWLRLARRTLFVCTHEETVEYRWHAGQASETPLRQVHSMFVARRHKHDRLQLQGERAMARRVPREILLRCVIEAGQAARAGDFGWIREVLRLRAELPTLPVSGLVVTRCLSWLLRHEAPLGHHG